MEQAPAYLAISSSKCAYKLVEKLKKALDVGLKVKEKRWEQGAGVGMKAIEKNGLSIAGRSSRSYFSKIDSGESFTDFTTKLHVHNVP